MEAAKTGFPDKDFLHMKVMCHVESMFADMHGPRCVRSHGAPTCLVHLIEAQWKQFEEESEADPDEKLVLGSEEAK